MNVFFSPGLPPNTNNFFPPERPDGKEKKELHFLPPPKSQRPTHAWYSYVRSSVFGCLLKPISSRPSVFGRRLFVLYVRGADDQQRNITYNVVFTVQNANVPVKPFARKPWSVHDSRSSFGSALVKRLNVSTTFRPRDLPCDR